MLAVLGYFWAEISHPLYDGKVSPGLKALTELPGAAWLQILAAIAVIELTIGKQDTENKVSFIFPATPPPPRLWPLGSVGALGYVHCSECCFWVNSLRGERLKRAGTKDHINQSHFCSFSSLLPSETGPLVTLASALTSTPSRMTPRSLLNSNSRS